MKRYFAKIDERENMIWELDKNCEVFLTYKATLISFFHKWLGSTGNLFAVLEGSRKPRRFKVLFLSESPEGMKDYFNIDEFTSEDAYYWARYFGNKDVMINRVTDSQNAYCWARDIGNRDVMINRITHSREAYLWAKNIGDKEIMKEKITDKNWMKDFEKL